MMEKKINIAELLKNCPEGMELDCTMFENVTLVRVADNSDFYPIKIKIKCDFGDFEKSLTEYGQHINIENAKCVIFPKGKTTWEGFQKPFKDGDILAYTSSHTSVFIYRYKDNEPNYTTSFYVGYTIGVCYSDFHIYNQSALIALNGNCDVRLATEEEKQKLFDAIKANGYRWNSETNTLEKLIEPKFKVGDRIVKKNSVCVPISITKVSDEFYYTQTESSVGFFRIQEQDDWELIHDKFDITTLVPFESRVLVRNTEEEIWKPAVFGCYLKDKSFPYYILGGAGWKQKQCIPYEKNEHLLGTTNDCDDCYKTW